QGDQLNRPRPVLRRDRLRGRGLHHRCRRGRYVPLGGQLFSAAGLRGRHRAADVPGRAEIRERVPLYARDDAGAAATGAVGRRKRRVFADRRVLSHLHLRRDPLIARARAGVGVLFPLFSVRGVLGARWVGGGGFGGAGFGGGGGGGFGGFGGGGGFGG